MKLWDKNIPIEHEILQFTTGQDPLFDRCLAKYDLLGSMAHAIMLSETGLITGEEGKALVAELKSMYQQADRQGMELEEGIEDIHTQVEKILTEKLGDLGKKIHTGRSRNDQVLVDIKLYLRDELRAIVFLLKGFVKTLLSKSEEHRMLLMPGYTHFQVAMPSSFGLWFGAYAEALADDLKFLNGVYSVINQNPLGSAAGYGTSFPIDRNLTTRLLKFGNLHVNAINAQLSRGKTEWYMTTGIAAVAGTLGKMAMDSVLYLGQNYGFFSLPDALTTGSSIMPHKKNPDVLELIRAKCNRLQQLPSTVISVTTNLPSGYHRDFQILKELVFPAIEEIKTCIRIADQVMQSVTVNKNILDDPKYAYLFSVEAVNKKVMEGVPFRDAYRAVAREIADGQFSPGRVPGYTHIGSIGNQGTREIQSKLEEALSGFHFTETNEIFKTLTGYYR